MSDFLPCPFCGGTNLKFGGDDKVVGTWCLTCEASGPNEYGKYGWGDRAASNQSEIERLREALEPFAALAGSVFRAYEDGREMNASKADDDTVWGFDRVDLTYGALRRARAALEPKP